MTILCLFAATGTGVPAWLFGLAMICDTIIISAFIISKHFTGI